jgi:hypothetical protein
VYVSAVTDSLRCPTNSAIRAQGSPRRCSSEMRRWRRSCGDQSAFGPAGLRDRRPQRVGAGRFEKARLRIAEASPRSPRRAPGAGRPRAPAGLRGGRAQPHALARLVVVADQGQVDARHTSARPVEPDASRCSAGIRANTASIRFASSQAASGPDQVLSGNAYKVLALQVELCSPRLIASRAEARRRPPFGLSAGVLAAGPVQPVYSSDPREGW